MDGRNKEKINHKSNVAYVQVQSPPPVRGRTTHVLLTPLPWAFRNHRLPVRGAQHGIASGVRVLRVRFAVKRKTNTWNEFGYSL